MTVVEIKREGKEEGEEYIVCLLYIICVPYIYKWSL